jgi:hypothetical protein
MDDSATADAVRRLAAREVVAVGIASGLLGSFIFFWDILLTIARDGAPFRVVPATAAFVAPSWVWILGFTLLGLATGASYAVLRASPARVEATDKRRHKRSLVERAA